MYNLTKNNYHLKPKQSTIYTPSEVSQFIFELLKDKIPPDGAIIDPCSGKGNLLKPWKENSCWTYGLDIKSHGSVDLIQDFLTWNGGDFGRRSILLLGYGVKTRLVLCNPPFNGMAPKLAPEVWLDKILELFGKDIPIVLFAPIGLRICNDLKSKRWNKWTNGTYPAISSIVSLPRTIFPNTEFHSEILIFNIKGLQPHYFFNHESPTTLSI